MNRAEEIATEADGFIYIVRLDRETNWKDVEKEIDQLQRNFNRSGVPGILLASHSDTKSKLHKTKYADCKDFVKTKDMLLCKPVSCCSSKSCRSVMKTLMPVILQRWE